MPRKRDPLPLVSLDLDLPNAPANNSPVCMADGCERATWARNLCQAHYQRWRRYGDINAVRRQAPVTFTEDGYVKWKGRSVHRIVLYRAIGYGPHYCYWCGTHINWVEGARASGTWDHVLTVDHLDHDRKNNRPSNLVPACYRCNKGRTRKRAHLYTPYNPEETGNAEEASSTPL